MRGDGGGRGKGGEGGDKQTEIQRQRQIQNVQILTDRKADRTSMCVCTV